MNKWIPVKDRPPAQNGSYLVTIIKDGKPEVVMAVYKDSFETMDLDAVAWMEKPEPYKKVEK